MSEGISRRKLLVGGGVGVGLLLGWAVWPRSYRPNVSAAPGETIFNAFLKIAEDGRISVLVPQAEMGQGVYTALPQILADELGADWRTVGVEPAPIGPLYANALIVEEEMSSGLPQALAAARGWAAREIAARSVLMLTAGSTSIRGFEAPYREAGAAARVLLCMAAAKRWDADWRACDTRGGFVVRGEERLRFGALAAEAATLSLPNDVPLRSPEEGQISGVSLPRLDMPTKLDGTARFAADVRLPDMVYASVRHGPPGDTRLVAADAASAKDVPGLIAIVREAGWIAAVATNGWAAQTAVNRLALRFETGGVLADSAEMDRLLSEALTADDAERLIERGGIDEVLANDTLVTADYAVAPAAHAQIEPLAATARISGDQVEVWTATQAPVAARAAVARALGWGEGQVTIYPMLAGGGYGRHFDHDAAVQAALIARKVGRPVQLVWSRLEEIRQDRPRPPARARMSARLGRGGAILGWKMRLAAPDSRIQPLVRSLPGWAGGGRSAAIEGATPPYALGALAIEHAARDVGLPTGTWRGGAAGSNCFFVECFTDELARKANADPLSYRMQLLVENRRLFQCLATVSALAKWDGGVPGSNQGVAAFSGFGSHIAVIAEAHVGAAQEIVVDRLFAAVDCGRMINPDIVLQQIEGGLLWGAGSAVGSALSYTRGLADARNLDALRPLTLASSPEIAVELIRSSEAPGGVSGLGVPPAAPAIANAIFAATGQRLRNLPLTPGAA